MDKLRKEIFVLFKDYGYRVMQEIRCYRKTHEYQYIQMATITYEYYRIILEIIRSIRNKKY